MGKKNKPPAARKAFQHDAKATIAALHAAEQDAAATAATAKKAADRIEGILQLLDPLEGSDDHDRATRKDLSAELADFRAIERSCQERLTRLAEARKSLKDTVASVESSPD